MGVLVSMGAAAIIESLKQKKDLAQVAEVIAKVYVKIERAAAASPMLTAAIERQRQK